MNISLSLIIDDHTQDVRNFTMENVSLKENLTFLDLQNMYKQSEDNDIYIICGGEVANSLLHLNDLGVREGTILKLVIKKRVTNPIVLSKPESIREIIKKHRQMMKTRFKQVINESLEQGLDTVMGRDYGLETDLLAFSVASDYRLLRTLLDSTENLVKLLEQCPVLIPAALKMVNIIQDKLKKVGAAEHVTESDQDPRYFSLGEVEHSDDSSEDDSEEASSSRSQPSTSAGVSRAQLRAAISRVGVRGQPQSAPVSLAQLRSAIHTAVGGHEPMEVDESPAVTASSEMATNDGRAQKLDQLVAMGFSDTVANNAALEATGGNVEAAIELLLG